MKKILFFLGRRHHAEKLLPVAMAGQEMGRIEPFFLIADNAINIDPPSEFVGDFQPILNTSNVYHLKSFEPHSSEIDTEVYDLLAKIFNEKTSTFVSPFWIAYSTREMVRVYHAMENMLEMAKPDAVFVLHSQNFWTKPLTYLANSMNIATYSLQEGLILEKENSDMSKYAEMGEYMTNIFTWSKHNIDIFGKYKDIVIPTGPPHLDVWVEFRDNERERVKLRYNVLSSLGLISEKKTVYFAFPLLHSFLGDPIEALRPICNWTLRNNINTIVSFHPFEGNEAPIIEYLSRFPTVKIYNGDPMSAILSCDVLISQTSTIAIEALMLGKHVVEYDPEYKGLNQSLFDVGAAQLMTGHDLTPVILALDGRPELDLKRFTQFVGERIKYVDGKASERIIDIIAPESDEEE